MLTNTDGWNLCCFVQQLYFRDASVKSFSLVSQQYFKKPTWRSIISKDQLISSWLRCWLNRGTTALLPFLSLDVFWPNWRCRRETDFSLHLRDQSVSRCLLIKEQQSGLFLQVAVASVWAFHWSVEYFPVLIITDYTSEQFDMNSCKLNTSVSASHTAIFGFKGSKPGRTLWIEPY